MAWHRTQLIADDSPDKVRQDGATPCVCSNSSVVLERIGEVGKCDKEGACVIRVETKCQSRARLVDTYSYLCADSPFHAERDLSMDVGSIVQSTLVLGDVVNKRVRGNVQDGLEVLNFPPSR